MQIGRYVTAFRDLHKSIDLTDRVGSLQLYASACALYRDMHQFADDIPEGERPPSYGYTLEKLGYWLDYLGNAVIPVKGDERTPEEWLETARGNLSKVGTNWESEDDW